MAQIRKLESLKEHPALNDLIPPLSEEEYSALKRDIANNGILSPLLVAARGEYLLVIDGHHRRRVALELGMREVPATRLDGLDDDEIIERGLKANTNRRNLNRDQKRNIVSSVLRRWPERADSFLAHLVGVSDHTIAEVRSGLETTSQIAKFAVRVGKDGRHRQSRRSSGQRGERKNQRKKITEREPAETGFGATPDGAAPDVSMVVARFITAAEEIQAVPDESLRLVLESRSWASQIQSARGVADRLFSLVGVCSGDA